MHCHEWYTAILWYRAISNAAAFSDSIYNRDIIAIDDAVAD